MHHQYRQNTGLRKPVFWNILHTGIPSRKYNKSPPFFEFLVNLYGVQNSFNLNLDGGNESPSLVLEIIYVISSPPEAFLGKAALKICGKYTGEHPC